MTARGRTIAGGAVYGTLASFVVAFCGIRFRFTSRTCASVRFLNDRRDLVGSASSITGSDRRLAPIATRTIARRPRNAFWNLKIPGGLRYGVRGYLQDLRSRVQLLQVPPFGRSHATILTRRREGTKLAGAAWSSHLAVDSSAFGKAAAIATGSGHWFGDMHGTAAQWYGCCNRPSRFPSKTAPHRVFRSQP